MYFRLIISLLFIFVFSASASIEFDKQQARQESFELLKEGRRTKYVVENLEQASEKEKQFINFYINTVEPLESSMNDLLTTYRMYNVMIDRALYNSEDELQEWEDILQASYRDFYKAFESDEYKLAIRKWYALSKGLSGKLVQAAKDSLREVEKESLPEEHRWIRQRIKKLEIEIDKIANNYPRQKELLEVQQKVFDLATEYRSGKISIEEAIRQKREITLTVNSKERGRYIAETGRKHFRELAILRTNLAKIKGFKTWAEYILSDDAKSYRAGFRTPKQRMQFLRGYLSKTKLAYKKYLKYIIETQSDYKFETFNFDGLLFLSLDSESLVRDFFDKNKVDEVWRQTMMDSGFPDTVLENVITDNYPREGKHTHAYMSPVLSHLPKYKVINAENLNLEGPSEGNASWYPAKTFIVQNFELNSPRAYETSFHEGGHGLDYNYREVVHVNNANNSYTETHSMTMEHFLLDEEYVRETFKDENGNSIPEETLQLYLKNKKINELVYARGAFDQALFDIAVWDYEYTETSLDYVDNSLKLENEISKKYWYRDSKKDEKELYENGYRNFVTSHYYSGSVRYIGYVYANMAAGMSIEKIYDELEKTTGRRSLYKQPNLASILIEGYYKKGFEKQFPQNIEDFTGKEFKPKNLASEYKEFIESLVKESQNQILTVKCMDLLSKK